MIKLQGPSRIINHDETLEVERSNGVTYVEGLPVESGRTTFNIICNIQPLTGRDLLIVPEGDRLKEQYFIWCEQNEQILLPNDMVKRDGLNFQIQSVENWGSYTRARIMRIDIGPDRT